MNISRLSTLTLGLAIAVFALSYSPSFADRPGSGDCGLGHCPHDGDDDNGGGKFTVQIAGGDLDTTACEGLTKGKKLSVVFPGVWSGNRLNCGVVMINVGNGVFPVYLGEIAVTNEKHRPTARLFFTSMPFQQFPGNEFGYQSEGLEGTINPDGTFVINKTSDIIKSNQPGKGDTHTDAFFIGTIVYTPK